MNRMLRLMSGLILAGVATIGTASVPTAWEQFYPTRTFSKLARDASGFLYVVSRETFGTGSVLYVDKFTPGGVKLWQNEYLLASQKLTADIRSVTVDNTYVYVVVNERSFNTAAVVQKSRMLVYAQSNGNVVLGNSSADASEYTCASSNNSQIALLSETTAGVGQVQFFNRSNFSSAGIVNLGNVASVGEVRIDASGNAYTAANNLNGTVQIAKCSAAGGLAYQTALSSSPRTNGNLARIELDTTNDRVYGLAAFDWNANDQDAILFSVTASSGAAGTPAVVGGSSTDDLLGDLVVVNNGVLLTLMVPSSTSSVVTRRNTNGGAVWSRLLLDTRTAINRPIGFDVDGHVVVQSFNQNDFAFQFDKVNQTTGTVINRKAYSAAYGLDTADMEIDSAGNMFVLTNYINGTRLARLQDAQLLIDANNIPGGQNVGGRLEVAAPAAVQQVWTLASSNSAVAAVPASLTVEVGSSQTNFSITVSPVTATTSASITARYDGFVCQQTLTVLPSTVNNLTLSPQVVKGGLPSTGTVTLRGKAIAGGLTVWLSSNKTLVASIPGSIVVPEGADQATFPITTYGVNSNQGVVITATTGAVSKTAFFAVNAPSLQSIVVSPGSLKGGVTGSLTVTLDGIAPTGGFSIVLFSGAPGIVTLPASASVSPNQTSRSIAVPTTAVSSTINVTLIATRSGIYKTTTLTVNP